MEDHTGTKILTRDCEAIRIPSGETFKIAKGTRVVVTQALGGSFTIATDQGLARITDSNADALGIKVVAKAEEKPEPKEVEKPKGSGIELLVFGVIILAGAGGLAYSMMAKGSKKRPKLGAANAAANRSESESKPRRTKRSSDEE